MSCPAAPKRELSEHLTTGGSARKRARRSSGPVGTAVKVEVKKEPIATAGGAPTPQLPGARPARRSARIKAELEDGSRNSRCEAVQSQATLDKKIKREGGGVAKVISVKAEVKDEVKAEVTSKTLIPTDTELPYPKLKAPTEAQCQAAVTAMADIYGLPSEREERKKKEKSRPLLDSLVGTILSQNTTDVNSHRAFASLKAAFPTWRAVLDAPPGAVEESIRSGGLADIKCARIKAILNTIVKERGQSEPSMEYLWELDTAAVKAELGRFKGVGPKTISCVLMFTMRRDEFPVDTHVWKLAMKLGWVPKSATRETTYDHLNHMVPYRLKYDLHCLLVEHGKALRNELGCLKVAKC